MTEGHPWFRLDRGQSFLPVLIGGDYLSVARARGAQLIHSTSELVKHTLGRILTLLTQCFVVLPPNLAEQVKWSRFVNVRGQPGRNISCDLHMEHLNRVGTAIEGLGANKTEKAIVRAGKCVGKFEKILDVYDQQTGVAAVSVKHSKPSHLKDLHEIVQQLLEASVFNTSQSHLKPNLSEKDLKDWIVDNISKYTSCH